MELIFREMFATTGQLNQANPGSNFSQVQETFFQRAGGPRLEGLPAASADIREFIPAPLASASFPTAGNRVFLGAWFFIKRLQDHPARILAVTNSIINPGPSISVENKQIGAGIAYREQTILNENVFNRWVFLGIAVIQGPSRTGSVRYYYKFPGEPMQVFGSLDNADIGMGDIGGALIGVETNNSGIRCRIGAPSAYRFESNDFSDITYPSDLIEPETGLTWYCNPATGNDANDGTAPDRAWATLAKLNEESRTTGMFSADSAEEGDTLIIDTGGAPLDALGVPWIIQTSGLTVRAAPGNEWIRVKSWRSIDPASWEPSGIPNVYSTTDTQTDVVIWEDDKFLHHPVGANLAAVTNALSSTPGSFWTDGVRMYLHPFGSTDPRIDGKRYERSHFMTEGAAVMLKSPNLDISDLHVGKTCLSRSYDGNSIGAYCLGNDGPMGNTRISHCYLYYGSKHNIGLVQGGPGDDVLVEDVQCEQGSPYGGPGGQTVFVSFNHQALPLGIIHRYHRCKTVANAGLIGSADGTMSPLFPVFYAHNLGTPGEPKQFALFELIDCDFGTGPVFGSASENLVIKGSKFGDFSFGADAEIDRCRIQGPINISAGYSLAIRNSLIERGGMLTATSVAGRLVIEGCNIDGSGITSIQGGVPQSALFTRSGPIEVIFRNNAVVMPAGSFGANLFSLLRSTDALTFEHNVYRLGGSRLVYNYHDGSGATNPNFAQWQGFGYDAGAFLKPDLVLPDAAPALDSPLVNAGVDLALAEDYTGRRLFRRNDIGAYEGPATRFDEWQYENFTDEELLDSAISGQKGSLHNDGVPNLMKYGLGLEARSPAQTSVFQIKKSGGNSTMFEFPRSLLPDDLEWTLERSADLADWQVVPGATFEVFSTQNLIESLRLTLPAGDETRFFRVRVSEVEP